MDNIGHPAHFPEICLRNKAMWPKAKARLVIQKTQLFIIKLAQTINTGNTNERKRVYDMNVFESAGTIPAKIE